MAKNNQRDPNLRAKTVARVNQLGKAGLSKAAAFEKISAETGRAKDAVQMLYYRAIRAAKAAGKSAAKAAPNAAPKAAAPKATGPKLSGPGKFVAKAAQAPVPVAATPAAPTAPKASRRRRSLKASPRPVAQTGDFPALLNGIAVAINNLLKHVEKTVEENKTLKEQAERLKAITSLIRGR